jgi:hypothetical protein
MNLSWTVTVNSEASRAEAHRLLDELYDKHKYVDMEFTAGSQRTEKQNNALHQYLTWLADALNDAGLDQRKVLKPEVDIPWTKTSAKEFLWKPIQEALTNKESTKDADRVEYSKVKDVLERHLAQKFGLPPIPWPRRNDKEKKAA